jgi:hypothetical protein
MISIKEQKRILNEFKRLADNTGYKIGTKAFKNAEVAFFAGIYTVLNDKTPSIWIICLQTGKSIYETCQDLDKNKNKNNNDNR